MNLPSPTTRYRVPARILRETRTLLAPLSAKRKEGVVVWWGIVNADDTADVITAYRPRQISSRTPSGLWVRIPSDAVTELIDTMPESMTVLTRLHTHGEDAYHSEMDDQNMLIAHQGAISIVIPHFAVEPISLSRCSVNMLVHGHGWVELGATEIAKRFEVVDD